jgi:hypothetical protein
MKGNPQKRMTFEDKFDRRYACWVKNNRKAWHWWKRKNRKDFRRKMKQKLDKEIVDAFNESVDF